MCGSRGLLATGRSAALVGLPGYLYSRCNIAVGQQGCLCLMDCGSISVVLVVYLYLQF